MSRSYKRTWGWTDQQHTKSSKWAKRQASKSVRRAEVVADGGFYKKHFCSWDICDYKFLFHSKKALEDWCDDDCFKSYKLVRK